MKFSNFFLFSFLFSLLIVGGYLMVGDNRFTQGLINPQQLFSFQEKQVIDFQTDPTVIYEIIDGDLYLSNEDLDINCNVSFDGDIILSPYKEGVRFDLRKMPDASELSATPIVDIDKTITARCNSDEAYNYFDWDTMKSEYSEPIYDDKEEPEIIDYNVKPQVWDYTKEETLVKIGEREVCDEYKDEICLKSHIEDIEIISEITINPTLNSEYTLTKDDYIYIDPTYIINITVGDSKLENVICEGGGLFCHLNISDENLVLYYPFDVENASSTGPVYDWTENDNDIVVKSTGVEWGEDYGISGGGYNFTSESKQMYSDEATPIGGGIDFTISFWYYPWKVSQEYTRPTSLGTFNVGSNEAVGSGWGFWTLYNQDDLRFSVCNTSNEYGCTYCCASAGSQDLDINTWYHFVGTFDKDTGNASFYANGGHISSNTNLNASNYGSSFLRMGYTGDFVNGIIDEVMYFNRTLTDNEIKTIYNSTFERFHNPGNHTIHPINITAGNNKVNVSVIKPSQNGSNTNLSLRVGYINKSFGYSDEDLSLYMPFEWNKAWDISGSGNDGTVTDAVWNASGGLNGTGGYEFDGVNDYIELDNLDEGGEVTLSVWINTAEREDYQRIVDAYKSNSGFQLSHYTQDKIRFLSYNDTSNSVAGTSTGLDLNKWYHVVGLYNGTHSLIYINGVLINNGSYLSTRAKSTSSYNYIGRRVEVVQSHYNGSMDQLMIFNRALSQAEITALYNNQSQNYTAPVYTDYQNMTSGVNSTFDISENAGFVWNDFDYYSDANRFWSPVLNNSIIWDTYYESEAPPVILEPNASLIAPLNNAILTSNPIELIYNVTEDADNCTLIINSVVNDTDLTITKDVNQSWSLSFPDGDYLWNVTCNSSQFYNSSQTFNFTMNAAVDTEYPIFSDYEEDPSDPATYIFGTDYIFNVSILSGNGNAWISFGSRNLTATNETDEYEYNVSVGDLGVGTHTYNWSAYGNGTAENFNMSGDWTYTINTADPTGSMTLTVTSPIEYGETSDFSEGETNNGDDGCVYDLNVSNQIYGAGTITGNYSTEGCTNYTSGMITEVLTINPNSSLVLGLDATTPIDIGTETDFAGSGCPDELSCSLNISNGRYSAGTISGNYSTEGNINYTGASNTFTVTIDQTIPQGEITNDTNFTYTYNGLSTTIGLSESNSYDADLTYIIYNNGVSNATGFTRAGAGTFDIVLNTTGGVNWTANSSMDTATLTINQDVGIVNASLNNTQGNFEVDEGEEANLNCSQLLGDSAGNLTLYREGVLINSGVSPIGNITTFSSAGTENITCYYEDSQNYSVGYEEWTMTINIGDTTNPLINLTLPNNITYTTNVSTMNYTYTETNCDSVWFSNDSGVTNHTRQDCGTNFTNLESVEGTNTWIVYINDTVNNQNSSNVTFFKDTVVPNCTIISYTPSDIEANSTGVFEAIINCTDMSSINLSSMLFVHATTDSTSLPFNWSWRPPANNKGAVNGIFNENILLADGRGDNKWYDNYVVDGNQLFTDNYSYSVQDNSSIKLTITNGTYGNNYWATMNLSWYIDTMFENVAFLSRGKMEKEAKKNYSIYNNNPLLIKHWNPHFGQENYTVGSFLNVDYTGNPNKNLNIYFCNSSYLDVTCSGDLTTCGTNPISDTDNCVYVNSLTETIIDSPKDFTSRNSSYLKGDFAVTNNLIAGIYASKYIYMFYQSDTASEDKAYYIKYANESSGTNVSFKDSKVAWISTDEGNNWVQAEFTPDNWFTQTHGDSHFLFGAFVEDNYGNNYSNFSMVHDDVGETTHPISSPSIQWLNSSNNLLNVDLNGTYNKDMNIKVLIALDPDSVGNVTHNLTLHNIDGTWNYTINESFVSPTDADMILTFDTTDVSDGHYRINITAIAGDDATDVKSFMQENNFTIDNTPPYFTSINHIESYVNESISEDFDADDGNSFGCFAVNDTTNFAIDCTGQLTNLTTMTEQIYTLNITINDSVGNLNSTWIWINVSGMPPLPIEYPIFSTYEEAPTDPNEYSPATEYKFNTTVLSTNGSIWISIGDRNISATNSSREFESSVGTLGVGIWTYNWSGYSNDSYGTFNQSEDLTYTITTNNSLVLGLTDDTPISVGTSTSFDLSGCPNELTCNLNISDGEYSAGTISANYSTDGNNNYSATSTTFTVTINQATTSLTLDATTPITYGTTTDFTGSGCPAGESCTLNITNAIYGAGTISANYSYAGNTNYTADSDVKTVTINRATGVVYTLINSSRSNLTIIQNHTANLSGFSVAGEIDIDLYNNGTLNATGADSISIVFNYTIVGAFNITTISNSTQNYTSAFETWWVNVVEAIAPTIKINVSRIFPDEPLKVPYLQFGKDLIFP